ncbi:hypothetical protein BDV26DRAFT_273919 [Aspergillus bertholletiae]|uniref:Uncharacterized protein n=1 Tax=Aspergillus bertholletiae TaxID=1226010 RepID=A0A5N7ATC3_9EURO|nr:hypothetical protein BDV26DRAFT_273919 [Aspergillus bertholletiae]
MDQNTRPRRLSLTQHLQRILHIDDLGNRHSSSQVSPGAGFTASPQEQLKQEKSPKPRSYLGLNEKSLHTHTSNHTSCSYTSLGSKLAPMNGERREGFSKLPAHEMSFQKPQASCALEETPTKSNICVSPTWTNNSAQRKEKRATLRLEAERVELEKKLMKLEQTESPGYTGSVKREPRRLTKKQPFGSSSRASSVSVDESRASRRISSIFSSSRRSSRSRSSSLNEDDKGPSRPQSFGPGGTLKSDPSTTSATRSLSTTLPERLGTAISKELAIQSNPLLPHHMSSLRPHKLSHPEVSMAASPGTKSNDDLDKNAASISHVRGLKKPRQKPTQQNAPITMSMSNVQLSDSSELDRSSFAAALNFTKRVSGKEESHRCLSQSTLLQNATAKEESHRELSTNGPSREKSASITPLSTNYPGARKPLLALRLGSSRSVPVRTPPQGKAQGYHRSFTSSPLAGFSTTTVTTLHSLDVASTEQETATFGHMSHTELPAFSKITASSDTNPPQPMAPLRPSNGDGIEDRHTPVSLLESASKAKENLRTRLSDGSRLSDHNPKPRSSSPTPNSRLKVFTTLNQGVRHTLGPVEPYDYDSPSSAFENHSQRCPPRHENHDGGLTAQTPLGEKTASTCLCDSTSNGRREPSPRDGPTSALYYRIGRSAISLSASLSQDPESEYNTADEAASSTSKSQSEESIPVEQLNIASVPTGLGTFPNKCSPSMLYHAPKTVHPNTPALWTRQAEESPKQLRRGQLVAKLFVICCHCEFWHDMPSEMYAKLAFPTNPSILKNHIPASFVERPGLNDQALSEMQASAASGSPIELSVTKFASPKNTSVSKKAAQCPSPAAQCCWCKHYMSKVCCQGWTTVVDLRERHH